MAGKSLRGLEITGLALIDIENNTGFHLLSVQTPNKKTLEVKDWTRIDHYADVVTSRAHELGQMADYLCVDGFFAKKKFVDAILEKTPLHLISKLRNDANLRYLCSLPLFVVLLGSFRTLKLKDHDLWKPCSRNQEREAAIAN